MVRCTATVPAGEAALRVLSAIIASVGPFLPWVFRRFLHVRVLGHDIHPSARIGFSIVKVEKLSMAAHARIGHLTMVKGLSALTLDAFAHVGSLNWVSAFPRTGTRHYAREAARDPVLHIGEHSAITSRHLLDCTNAIRIGSFTTIAGYRSVLLTHSIDLETNRQVSSPITIGDYCFVGSCCTMLAGSALPSMSILGAHSLLNKAFHRTETLYGGVPAKPIRTIPAGAKYFMRQVGFVE